MNCSRVILILAFGHGLNDLIAGYFLGFLVQSETSMVQIGLRLLLYNLIAFGGQYPVALLLEKTGRPRQWLIAAFGLNVFAVIFFDGILQLSIIIAGIASAMYHVAGGTVCAINKKAAGIGIFAAPGVAGLIAGGYLAYKDIPIFIPLFAATAIFLFVISRTSVNDDPARFHDKAVIEKKFAPGSHDLIMILLLTVISLRSVIWNIFQMMHEGNYEWLIAIAISASIGKMAGGWLADKIGWKLYALLSLVSAAPLLIFFKKELAIFCIGAGLLQSGIPATASLLIHSMKGKIERAIGLSFGAAIIFGAVLFYFFSPYQVLLDAAILCLTIAVMILIYFLKIKPLRHSRSFK